jgi:hypothetical protein
LKRIPHRAVYIRVEKTPVPIILLKLRNITVTQPTEYPNGELTSTGAPEASWYVALEVFPPTSWVYLKLSPSLLSSCGIDFAESFAGSWSPIVAQGKMESEWYVVNQSGGC